MAAANVARIGSLSPISDLLQAKIFIPEKSLVDEKVQAAYLKNRRKQRGLLTESIIATAVCIGGAVILALKSSPLLAVAFAISAIAFGIVFIEQRKVPDNLAKQAYNAMTKGEEEEAIEALKKGANIYSLSLPQHASALGCHQVLRYLASVGVDFKTITESLEQAKKLKTVKLLVEEFGVPVNGSWGVSLFRHSPLYFHVKAFFDLIKESNPSQEAIGDCCEIIKYLCEQGATLQLQDLRSLTKQAGEKLQQLIQILCEEGPGIIQDYLAQKKLNQGEKTHVESAANQSAV